MFSPSYKWKYLEHLIRMKVHGHVTVYSGALYCVECYSKWYKHERRFSRPERAAQTAFRRSIRPSEPYMHPHCGREFDRVSLRGRSYLVCNACRPYTKEEAEWVPANATAVLNLTLVEFYQKYA